MRREFTGMTLKPAQPLLARVQASSRLVSTCSTSLGSGSEPVRHERPRGPAPIVHGTSRLGVPGPALRLRQAQHGVGSLRRCRARDWRPALQRYPQQLWRRARLRHGSGPAPALPAVVGRVVTVVDAEVAAAMRSGASPRAPPPAADPPPPSRREAGIRASARVASSAQTGRHTAWPASPALPRHTVRLGGAGVRSALSTAQRAPCPTGYSSPLQHALRHPAAREQMEIRFPFDAPLPSRVRPVKRVTTGKPVVNPVKSVVKVRQTGQITGRIRAGQTGVQAGTGSSGPA